MKLRHLLLAPLCILLLASPALAADDNLMKDVIYLDPVVVTGTAEEDSLVRSKLRVEEKSRSNTIADYLSNDTEISFKRKASIGDSGDVISIRGFESKRIQLNLDGRNISSTGIVGGNYIDFGTIPLDNIEKIEIIKGGSSLEYGNKALGGVINAYSKEPVADPSASIYMTSGGWDNVHDFHNIRAHYAQMFGSLGLSMGVSHQQAEAYLRNNDYESFHFYPKGYVDLPWKGRFIVGYNYSSTKRGLIRSNRDDGSPTGDSNPDLPGYDNAIDDGYPVASGEYFAGGAPTPSMTVIGEGAYWRKVRHLLDLTYHQEITDDAWAEAMFYRNRETRRERNYADVDARMQIQSPADPFDPALTSDGDLVLDRDITVDKSYGTKLKAGWDLGEHSLLAGVEYKVLEPGGTEVVFVDTNYNAYGPNGWTGAMASQDANPPAYVTGAFAGDTWALADDLTLDFGLRFDKFSYSPDGADYTIDESKVSPKATVTYDLDDRQTVTLAAYQNYRTPTIPELYWNTQASSTNPSVTIPYLVGKHLKPETQLGADLAYKYRFQGKGFVQVSGFYYDISDYILHKAVYVDRPPYQSWAAYNADATIYGTTLSASYPVLDTVAVHASATWQKTKKENDPADPDNVLEKIDYIPDFKSTLGLTWNILDDLTLDTTLSYVGERDYTINTSALQKGTLDSYATLGASLRYQLDEHTTLELYGDNLTDTDYEEYWGYPGMGLNMGVSIKWQL